MSNKKLGAVVGTAAASVILFSCTHKGDEEKVPQEQVQTVAAEAKTGTASSAKIVPLTAKPSEQVEIKTEAMPKMPAWIHERNVSNHAGYDGGPSVSNDGCVAFESDRAGKLEIFVLDPKSNKLIQISKNGTINRSPSIAGDRVIFSSSFEGNADIYSFSLKEGQLRNLSRSKGYNVQPTISGDGEQVAFVSTRNGALQLISGNQKALKGLKLNFAALNPSVANDGAIAFEDTNGEVYMVDRSGLLRNISYHPELDSNPCISANGRRVVFGSLRNNRRSICVYDRDLNKLNIVAEGFNAQISGAGNIVVYEKAAENGKEEIYAVLLNDELDVVKSANLSYNRARDYQPAISADGKQLAFVSNRDGNPEVYKVSLEYLLK